MPDEARGHAACRSQPRPGMLRAQRAAKDVGQLQPEADVDEAGRAFLVGFATVACIACSRTETAVPDWCSAGAGDAVLRYGTESQALLLREAWRRGGLREGEELVRPEAPAIDRGGRVAFVDRALEEIIVVGKEAEWLGPVLTQGDGPDEVGLPIAVAWGADGDLLVADFERRQIVRRHLEDGQVVTTYPIPGGVLDWVYRAGEVHWGWFTLAPTGDVLLDRRDRADLDAPIESQLEKYAAEGPAAPRVLMRVDAPPLTVRRSWIAPGFPRALGAIGPQGVVAVAGDSEHYRVRLLASDGSDSVRVCRDTPGVPLSRAERGDTFSSGDGPRRAEFDELRGWLDAVRRPSAPLPMGRLFFGSTGRLWVQRDRPNPFELGPPAGSAYDVFSEGGRYVGTVQASPGVTLYGESEAWVIGYEIGSFDETSVVAYELVAPTDVETK